MKTKVVAFRVNQEQYDALVYKARAENMKLSDVVYVGLLGVIAESRLAHEKEQKRLEAKAKRDAKKAANAAQ